MRGKSPIALAIFTGATRAVPLRHGRSSRHSGPCENPILLRPRLNRPGAYIPDGGYGQLRLNSGFDKQPRRDHSGAPESTPAMDENVIAAA